MTLRKKVVDLKDFLLILARRDGSDIYLSTGSAALRQISGVLRALDKEPLPPGRVKEIAYSVMDQAQAAEFEKTLEMNLAISESGSRPVPGQYLQTAWRSVDGDSQHQDRHPQRQALGLPPVLTEVIMAKRGLILFVGGTGSGKSTSLAA
jgi:twitching motility protein PilU